MPLRVHCLSIYAVWFVFSLLALQSPAFAGGKCDLSAASFQGTGCDCYGDPNTAKSRSVLSLPWRENVDSKYDAGELYCYRPDFNFSGYSDFSALLAAYQKWNDKNGTSAECNEAASHTCPTSREEMFTNPHPDYSKCDCFHSLLHSGTPFCRDSLCQTCLSNADCEFGFPADRKNIDKGFCRLPKYSARPNYEGRKYNCSYCKQIHGTGWKKITFVFRGFPNVDDVAKEFTNTIIGYEPFGYLDRANTFQFQYVSAPLESYVKYELVEEPVGAKTYKYSSDTESDIHALATSVCPNTNTVIFIDAGFPVSSVAGYTRPDGSVYAAPFSGTVVHELGHAFCDLSDEYYIDEHDRFLETTMHHINQTSKNIARDSCSKFTSVDSRLPCIPIVGPNGEGGVYKKSSAQSLMNNNNTGFNLMSCVACLMKMSDLTTDANAAAVCRTLGGVILP